MTEYKINPIINIQPTKALSKLLPLCAVNKYRIPEKSLSKRGMIKKAVNR